MICDKRKFYKISNASQVVNVNEIKLNYPSNFTLEQTYTNSFNPITKIKYSVPFVETQHAVSLSVFDILGNQVSTLVNKVKEPGTYEVEFDGSNLPSGIYFYRPTSDSFTETKKLVLLK